MKFMKLFTILFVIFGLTGSAFCETKKEKERRLKEQATQAFMAGNISKLSPELREHINTKFFEFDNSMVTPGFSHNVFWINHLNKNFSTRPRFYTEIITNTITRIIPGYTIPGGTRTELVGTGDYEWVGTGKFKNVWTGDYTYTPTGNYEWVPTGNMIDNKNNIIGYKPDIVSNNNLGMVETNGERTLFGKRGWATGARADFIKANPDLFPDINHSAFKNADYKAYARNELTACAPGPCNIEIGTPPGLLIHQDDPNRASCSNSSSCNVKYEIVGGYREPEFANAPGQDPTPYDPDQGEGEWKPIFKGEEEILVPGDPLYEQVPEKEQVEIIDKDKEYVKEEIKEKEEIMEEKEITEEDTVVPDEEVEEEITEEKIRRAKKEWKISFAPAYFIDYDFGKLILNQAGDQSAGRTPASVGKGQQKYVPRKVVKMGKKGYTPEDPVPRLELNEEGPYLVKKFFQINAGMGGTMSANYANAGLLSQLGLSLAILPTIGGGAKTTRMVDTIEEAKKAKQLNLPGELDDFADWKVGDKLEYDVHGGISFTGGVGFYGLAAGVSYVAQGLWKRTYIKAGDNKIYGRVDKNKLMSFGAYLAAGLANLSINKFISWEDGLTFTFNTNTKKGRELLKQFMKGKMKAVQKAARNESDPNVIAGFKIKGRTHGWAGGASVGIPYIPVSARWNKSNFLSENKTTFLGGKRFKKDTVYAKVTTFAGKFFPIFRNYVDGFFANVRVYSGARTKFMGTVKTGQYSYNFQKSYTKVSQLKKVIERLKKKTGLIDYLDVEFPEELEKVGSAELKFALKFKTAATQFLIAQREKMHFEKISKSFIDSYFTELKNPGPEEVYNLCAVDWKIYRKRCEKKFHKESKKAIAKMKKALNKMAEIDGTSADSREIMAKAYADFGEAMIKNPFVFQTVLNMTLGRGADIYYSIETTKTKKYESILRFVPMNKKKKKSRRSRRRR